MYRLSIAVMLAAIVATSAAQAGPLSTGPTAGKVEIPSCEVFMKRLRDAGKVLTFPLPPVKIERVIANVEKFWVGYDYGDGTDYEGSVECENGKFVDYYMDFPLDEGTPGDAHRTQIASAAVYALTVGKPRDIIMVVAEGLAKRPKTMDGGSYDVQLSRGFGAEFSFGTLIIQGRTD